MRGPTVGRRMFVGIDVAKAERVAAGHPSQARWTVTNDERGIRTVIERLREPTPTLIVLEATGGYELRRCDRPCAPIPNAEAQELDAMRTRRLQLIEMLGAERNRLGQVFGKGKRPVKKSLKTHIAFLERELRIADSDLGGVAGPG